MALERVGRVVLPEFHELLGVFLDAAVAVIDVAVGAADDVGDWHVEPLPLADDLRHFLPVRGLVAPLLGFHHCHQQRFGGIRILVDPGCAQAERFFRMLGPDLAGRAGGKADALVDELFVPRLADAEGVHVADLHVRHHLRRRYDDGGDVLVGVDAAGGEPIADPQVVGAAREGHRDLHFLARGLLLLEGGLQRRRIGGDLEILVFVGDRDRLRVEIEARQQIHRRRHVVLRHLAGRNQVRHRRQDVRAIDAVALRAEHKIVARRSPGCLLGDFDIGHAVFGEQSLLLRDHERGGIHQRDIAKDRLGGFGTGGLCHRQAKGELRLHCAEQGGGAGRAFQQSAAADALLRNFGLVLLRHSSNPSRSLWLARPGSNWFAKTKKPQSTKERTRCERFPRDSGVAWSTRRWIVFGARRRGACRTSPFQASCQFRNLPNYLKNSVPYARCLRIGQSPKSRIVLHLARQSADTLCAAQKMGGYLLLIFQTSRWAEMSCGSKAGPVNAPTRSVGSEAGNGASAPRISS